VAFHDDQVKYELRIVKRRGALKETKKPQKKLLFGVETDSIDIGLKACCHCGVSKIARDFDALLQDLDRSRYVALAEKGSRFAKDAGVAFAFFRCSHEDY
jgi:hypothetical protein